MKDWNFKENKDRYLIFYVYRKEKRNRKTDENIIKMTYSNLYSNTKNVKSML